jgi:hypothetical protein
MSEAPHRRRLDRLIADDYLAGLESCPVAEVRTMRDDCREEESRLSYARRLVQGQLDIVRAERRRRSGEGDDSSLVAALSEILADAPAPGSREARSAPMFAPDEATYGAREHDTAVDDSMVGRVPDLSDDELDELEAQLVEHEAHVSRLRRTVLDNMDALSEELVRRYREGVDVDSIVAAAVGDDSAAGAE